VFAARLFRTPAERFDGIVDFPYRPEFHEWQGMRLAHIDVGQGQIVLLLHGEPTWSYLWRKVIPPLVNAGFRCIAPDLAGFGRSDKPVEPAWYSYDNHTAALVSLLDELDLHEVTLVMHDWGGPIGLRVAMIERPERVNRLVVMDTGVFTGEQQMSDEWLRFRAFVAARPDVPIWPLIRGGCKTPPSAEVRAAYEAPFPNEASKTGARRFPELIPLDPNAPGASEGRVVMQALVRDQRPALVLWADADVVLPLESVGRPFQRLFRTADDLTVIRDAGHFLQEDQGDQVGRVIGDWLTRQQR
jgi:haloalkane dehalogenase